MTYPKTITEVDKLEKKLHTIGCNPNEFFLITTQLKIDICEKHKNGNKNTKEFKNKVRSSMKEVRELLETNKKTNP